MGLQNERRSYKTYITNSDSEGVQYCIYNNKLGTSSNTAKSCYETVLCKTFLPDTYEELQYIETNGTGGTSKGQLINTGFVAGANMIFNLKADMTCGAVGTSTGSDSKTIFAVSYSGHTTSGQMMILYDEDSYDDPVTDSSWTGLHEYTIDYLNNRVGCDGVYQAMTRTVTRYSNELPFVIGAWYESGTFHYRAAGKFYQLRITTGTTKQLHCVPALRKSDNVPGMYDLVQGVFLTNTGTGSLGYMKKDGTYVAPVLG